MEHQANGRNDPLIFSRFHGERGLPVQAVLFLLAGQFAPVQASQGHINARARADYQAGQWQRAADLAASVQDADHQAFAARALLAKALLTPVNTQRGAIVNVAKDLAETALRLEANHIEGQLQLATALGLQARALSPASAFGRRLPQRVKQLLDNVMRTAPQQAWGHALLGGWHLEGLRIGGAAARTLLGVNLQTGKAAFAQAMKLDPDEASTPFYYAASFLALDPRRNVANARALLQRAQNCPLRDAFQAAVKARATALIQSIDTQGPSPAARLALSWL
ncbi:MAG: hypothetical protein HC777_03005 [Hyphomonadaceae bacterium]|nr:hypothetical protein [Hyphomonadaceae bacterium]